MASASARVCAILELLQSILLNVPAQALFSLQRVNTTWRDCIKESIHLQRKMFLKPAFPPMDPTADEEDPDLNDVYQTLLYPSPMRLNPCLDMTGCATATAQLSKLVSSTQVGASRVTQPPGLHEIEVHIQLRKWSKHEQSSSSTQLQSWRGTLLSQPPITTLKVPCEVKFDPSVDLEFWPEKRVATVSNPAGLTLGDLDHAWRSVDKGQGESFVSFSVVAPPEPEWVLCEVDEDCSDFTTCYLETPDEVGNCQCVRALRAEE
ncbi:uncharacterized protein MYCFIDRAFT_78278 [Pseudocercospora fijiensis CIRAD86]|uniref:F-box domain-containing protein n=1 Tax=Pseudocercospora fijiensis (strain CIRAD86) TaxID=383855 RepID=M2ZNA2_PSEFD|nr:uncharacterized protein MYCFIDRAFT_78278 [Pseudocercospora fijiensis CIRAD86]EME80579.1 hypothetical protein MYCFIDRAFT_78278 [Pseudocercospora fijiensis CIRAD86]